MNQVALHGLLPWQSLTLPCFPLVLANYTLFVTLSLVNTVALTSSKGQLIANGVILVVEHVLIVFFASIGTGSDELLEELGLADTLQFPLPTSMSVAYSVHLLTIIALSFVLCGHVALGLGQA